MSKKPKMIPIGDALPIDYDRMIAESPAVMAELEFRAAAKKAAQVQPA